MMRHPYVTGYSKHQLRGENLAYAHGLFLTLGGLWPLLHMQSFEAIAGNLHDEWLVRTVAAVLLLLGGLLLNDAFFRGHIARTLRIIAGGVALILGVVALIGGFTGHLAWVYVPVGLIHWGFTAGWIWAGRRVLAPSMAH